MALIPVIAKADSMTVEEMVAFRAFVEDECARHNIAFHDFSDHVKRRVGIPADLVVPPFAIVASNRFQVRSSVNVLHPFSFPPYLI